MNHSNQAALYSAHLQKMQANYLEAAEVENTGSVLIASGSLKTAFLDDRTYPFIANPHFKAFVPLIDVPDSFVLLRQGEKPQLLFHQPEDYWHMVPEMPTGYWVDEWEITPIKELSDAHNHLGNPGDICFIGEETKLADQWQINSQNPSSVINPLHFQRAYKTEYELSCLRSASELAALGHKAAKDAFDAALSEFEIQQAYLAAIRHREKETPYSNIVALNEHCAVLHYQFYEHDRYKKSELHSMLIDAGANFQGYAADVTRTYATHTGLFNDLVTAMDEAELAIIADIQVGMNYAELHEKMHWRLATILKQFGIVNMSEQSMLESNLTFTFLPHGLGHFLGLQTHDVGGFQKNPAGDISKAPEKYPALRLTRTIENQQVFTIEPGLYFIPMLLNELKNSEHGQSVDWTKVETLMPCGGIRIEDNVAIQNDKVINLTREAFAQL
jgi:Xaa-Pro dipeptidase